VVNILPLPVRRVVGGSYERWRAVRRQKKLLHSLRGDRVHCNVCGWKAARLTDDPWHAGTICPVCRSQVRHRMLGAMLDGLSKLPGLSESELLAGRDILHFAPEQQLRDRIRAAAKSYTTADYERGDCDLKLDMSAMASVTDATYDAIIACDVLEHVPDDRAALRELRRILRPGGVAILTVPQKDSPAVTDEDPSVTGEAEREKRFGQKDHVRMFGDDFADRVREAAFTVEIIDASGFEESIRSRHVLAPPEPNPHPLATNHRRIYVARVK
jgi:SAM-dependent methyltransferase